MAFNDKSFYGGPCIVEGTKVRLKSNSHSAFMRIDVGKPVKNAYWQGENLIVALEDGKVRKYVSEGSWSTI